ncbi:MAG TPA: DUF4386 family protein [Anaerolineales bacterium]|nr:DUF4386 family protein [Anaerolineales bacterium]
MLTRFHAGGNALIYTWLAFAWIGLPMLLGVIMLKRILEGENSQFLETATTLGVIGFVVQLMGLLRWVFVVPVLACLFTDPTTDSVTKHPSPLCLLPSINTEGLSSANTSVNSSPSCG